MATTQVDGRRAWSITAMLFFFYALNFLDKLALSVSAVPLMQDLHLSLGQYGTLSSSFFLLYAISGLLTGVFVVNRMSTKLLLIALVAIWSLSQFAFALSSSLVAIYLCRILLGVGEGPGNPVAIHALYGWFSNSRRSLPTGVFIAGAGVGFIVGAPLLSWVVAAYGWRSVMTVCGLLGVIWIWVWSLFGADGPLLAREPQTGRVERRVPVPWGRFWREPAIVANLVLATSSYWVTGLSVTWLAPYLRLGLGYDARDTGWLLSVILGGQVVLNLGAATLSDRLLAAGFSSRVARGLLNGICLMVASASLVAAPEVASPVLQILLLSLGFTLPVITFVIGPAILAEIAPASQVGTALLTNYTVITVAGFAAPNVAGRILDLAGPDSVLSGYRQVFWLTGFILIVGGIWGVLALDPDKARSRFAGKNPVAAVRVGM